MSFGKTLAVFAASRPADNHDAVYQYDALGRSAWAAARRAGESAWYANRFICAGVRGPDGGVVLHAGGRHVLRGARRRAR